MMPLAPKLENDPRENEDCLYLNVYVPKNPSSKELLPVLFYITGGIFMFNDGTLKSYKPYNFVERDIIMVSINFRQGPLGFLTTNDGVIPGNLGLWDQNMALRWVQKNIGRFGGDPNKVTINGHSSGAAAVTLHMLSKHSEGLFRAGIAQSNALLGPDGVQRDPKYYAYKFANTIDAKITPKNTSKELLEFLQSISASTISNTTAIHPDPEHDTRTFKNERYQTIWRPVEEPSDDENAFISGSIYEKFRDGKFNHVPLMIGITSEEYGMKGANDPEAAKLVDDHPELLFRGMVGVKEKDKRRLGEKIKKMYSTEPLQKNITAFVKLCSDMLFGNKVMKFGDVVSKHIDVYFYQFSYFGYMNEIPGAGEFDTLKMEGLGKATHCAELPYLLWYKLDGDNRTYPESDIRMRVIISDLLANFIKYLNPTPKRDPQLQNIIWPKFDSERLRYLDIDLNLTVKENPRSYRQIRTLY
ncbi:unnamed protein product [Callosobruchus maculatus]|nr:unnamed protein product [Callosobruchus maculatus]